MAKYIGSQAESDYFDRVDADYYAWIENNPSERQKEHDVSNDIEYFVDSISEWSNEDRVRLFSELRQVYCSDCGRLQGQSRCQCNNDE